LFGYLIFILLLLTFAGSMDFINPVQNPLPATISTTIHASLSSCQALNSKFKSILITIKLAARQPKTWPGLLPAPPSSHPSISSQAPVLALIASLLFLPSISLLCSLPANLTNWQLSPIPPLLLSLKHYLSPISSLISLQIKPSQSLFSNTITHNCNHSSRKPSPPSILTAQSHSGNSN
jgi:hypothetical protein